MCGFPFNKGFFGNLCFFLVLPHVGATSYYSIYSDRTKNKVAVRGRRRPRDSLSSRKMRM